MTSSYVATAWARKWLGDQAETMAALAAQAVAEAHDCGVRAHLGSGLTSEDAYGHTIQLQQFQCFAALAKEQPGVKLHRPDGSRVELVALGTTVFDFWRYGRDATTDRTKARFRTPLSGRQRGLLTAAATPAPRQLRLPGDGDDPNEPELTELDALDAAFADYAQVIKVGYCASSANNVSKLGWGDVVLLDESRGTVDWPVWEDLPLHETGAVVQAPRLLSATAPSDSRAGFAAAPMEDFDLAAKPFPGPGDPSDARQDPQGGRSRKAGSSDTDRA